MEKLTVLLVEDDPMVREVNRQFIERVDGFQVVAMAANGIEGYKQVLEISPDLVILDIFMPEQDGLMTLRKIRTNNLPVDVISVTAANDMPTIQQMLHLGVYDYIMKPFTFERMEQTLTNYLSFKKQTLNVKELSQKELDEVTHVYKETGHVDENNLYMPMELPKGFNRSTLQKVLNYIKESNEGASADDVSIAIGVARVTARRYLDFLEKQNLIKVDVHYGGIGRPVNQYYL